MRKFAAAVSVLMTACLLFAGAASADHGYIHTSAIPMASPFSVRVNFDDDGAPHVDTNYPFSYTGANEMGLTYSSASGEQAVALLYRRDTGETRVRLQGDFPDGEDAFAEAYRAIQTGKLRRDDRVYINTTNFSSRTDWFLVYSLREKRYVEYMEKNRGDSLDGMMDGGVTKTVYYNSRDEIDYSRMVKTEAGSDLLIEYDPEGEILFAYVSRPGDGVYNYDPATGLFGGKKISELGFAESDLAEEALAAESAQTRQTEIRARAQGETAAVKASFRLFGGLLSGVVIGILLYSLIRRRNRERRERPASANTDAHGEKAPAAPEEAPVAIEAPETKHMSSGR